MKPVCLIAVLALSSVTASAQKMDLSLGWDFQHSDQMTGYADMNGWYGSLSYNVLPRLGLTFEHQSLWGSFQGSGLNDHSWLGGVTVKLADSERRITPFIQPLVGDTRTSYAGSIQHSFTFQLAGGVTVKLRGPLSLELIPAEYILTNQAGTPTHSYSADVGLQFSFGH